MLHRSRAIVLYLFSYNDKYSLAHIYTEAFGLVVYMVSKSRSKRTKVPRSLFYSLSILDLEVEHVNRRDVHKIKEARSLLPSLEILENPYKNAMSMFLSEFLGKVLKDVQSNKYLFLYLYHSIQVLDSAQEGLANFHLVFMLRLSHFLGFEPDVSTYRAGYFFDLKDGIFVSDKPLHPSFIDPKSSEVFLLLLRMNYDNMHLYHFSRLERVQIIDQVLLYYRLHLTDFSALKSLSVLQDVFA
ncbi:DNA repair protein RecO [Bacteroidales bacterium]|nr:DNA repair protein RecO [Bacteroidales bacterium]